MLIANFQPHTAGGPPQADGHERCALRLCSAEASHGIAVAAHVCYGSGAVSVTAGGAGPMRRCLTVTTALQQQSCAPPACTSCWRATRRCRRRLSSSQQPRSAPSLVRATPVLATRPLSIL